MIYLEQREPTLRANHAADGIGLSTQYPTTFGLQLSTFSTENITPTAAQLISGLITHVSVTGAGTLTVPTGAILTAAIHAQIGDSFTCLYANTGAETVTITGATGVTVVGTAAVGAGFNAELTFVCTALNTWIVYTIVSA